MDEETKAAIAGVGVGAAGATVADLITAMVTGNLPPDLLKSALHPEAQVNPDNLADEIAKDPNLQIRWKAIREFVGMIDDQVGKNLEQGAGSSQETAKHWKDRFMDRRPYRRHAGPG